MTGTAYVTTHYTEINSQRLGYFERLSTWLFSNKNTLNFGCMLVDISTLGGAVLIPAQQIIPHDLFELIIKSAEGNTIFALLQARQRWVNKNYSASYIKVGFEFNHMDLKKHQIIQSIIKSVSTLQTLEIACSLKHNKG